MVADQDRLAGAHVGAQAAAAVGQDDGLAARGHGGADAVHDGGDAMALVVVGAAQEDEHTLVADAVRADPAAMALDRRGRKAGQVSDLELGLGGAERLHGRGPAGAHHEGDVVGLGTRELAQARGGVVGGGVGVTREVVRKERCVHAMRVAGLGLRA